MNVKLACLLARLHRRSSPTRPATRAADRGHPEVRRVPAEPRQVGPAAGRLLSVRERRVARDDADSGGPLQLRRVHAAGGRRGARSARRSSKKPRSARRAARLAMRRRSATSTRASWTRRRVEARGLEPLAGRARAHRRARRRSRMSRATSAAASASFVAHPFAFFVAIDEKNSDRVHRHGLPDRSRHAGSRLLPVGRRNAEGRAREVSRRTSRICLPPRTRRRSRRPREEDLRDRNALAKAHWTRVQNRDAEKTYNRYESRGAREAHAVVRLECVPRRRADPGGRKCRRWIVTQPSYFEALDKVIADDAGRRLARLLPLQAAATPTRRICRAKFVQLHFEFSERTVSGIEELKPRWKRGVDTVEGAVGDLVGKMYVERHFSAGREAAHGRAGRQSEDGVLAAASTSSSG